MYATVPVSSTSTAQDMFILPFPRLLTAFGARWSVPDTIFLQTLCLLRVLGAESLHYEPAFQLESPAEEIWPPGRIQRE